MVGLQVGRLEPLDRLLLAAQHDMVGRRRRKVVIEQLEGFLLRIVGPLGDLAQAPAFLILANSLFVERRLGEALGQQGGRLGEVGSRARSRCRRPYCGRRLDSLPPMESKYSAICSAEWRAVPLSSIDGHQRRAAGGGGCVHQAAAQHVAWMFTSGRPA